MNGEDIIIGLSFIKPELIQEAEFETYLPGKRMLNRSFLVAIIAVIMLLLVGCGVIYMMRMNDFTIGTQTRNEEIFYGSQAYESVSYQVLSLSGLKGSLNYQAAKDWFDFKRNYDPENAFVNIVWGKRMAFPPEYDSYWLYSQEMKDKVDEIAAKYGLKLAGKSVSHRTAKGLYAYLGLDGILVKDSLADAETVAAEYFDGGKLHVMFDLRMPEGEDMWQYESMCSLYYCKRDCFDVAFAALEDTGDWREWNYTTASGDKVLILRSSSDWRAWIFCQQKDATVSLRVEVTNDQGIRSWKDRKEMTDRQLEQVADAINFSINPQPGDENLLLD